MSKKEWAVLAAMWVIAMVSVGNRLDSLQTRQIDILDYVCGVHAQVSETSEKIAESGSESLTEGVDVTCESLGNFTVTFYDPGACCCGANADGITASGTIATPRRTVAVDPNVIPLGTVLLIDGIYYVAEDTGGAIKGKRIDICVATHEEAIHAGVKEVEVFKMGLWPVQ